MKQRFRVFRRGWGTYYCEDLQTGKQETLRTRDKAEAYRLVAARNETEQQPAFSLHLARVYWKAGDPAAATRTWQHAMDEIVKLKSGNTLIRWRTAVQDRALDPLRGLVLLETHAHHLLRVLEQGSVSTNLYLRRIHNFALDMNWLPWPVLAKKNWPVVRFKDRRAITRDEHDAIVAREPNPEWRSFLKLLWATGGSQSGIASLTAEHIDRENRILTYTRAKTGSIARLRFAEEVAYILAGLPDTGSLFPRLAVMHEKHRAKLFRRRCLGLGIHGVSLHSYRYAWAERAKRAGYPERFAQEALGHNSRAIHRAYARQAKVLLPSLESFEKQPPGAEILPFPGAAKSPTRCQTAEQA